MVHYYGKDLQEFELFGSAIFQDLTSDGIDDVIISGRSGQLLAINGFNGSLIWDYFFHTVLIHQTVEFIIFIILNLL